MSKNEMTLLTFKCLMAALTGDLIPQGTRDKAEEFLKFRAKQVAARGNQ